MEAIMALTWFLVLFVVEFFGESTCGSPVKPTCEDSALQYVFFLVSPSSEAENLTKFLGSIESATIFETPENEGMIQVVCDPKDWEEIHRYARDRGVHFLHSAYCIDKGELSALRELRLRENKLRKLATNEASDNYLGTGQGKSIPGDKGAKNEASKLLKNGRIIKTRAVNNAANKNAGKNRSAKTTTTKTNELCTPSTTAKTSRKSNPRRSVDVERESSWIGNTIRRIKRYSWEILTRNNNPENGDVSVNRREARGISTVNKGKKGISPKPVLAEDGESTVPSSGESGITESAGTGDDIGTSTEASTDATVEFGDEITSGVKPGAESIRVTHKHGTTKKYSDKSKTSESPTEKSTTMEAQGDDDHSRTEDDHCASIAPNSYAELADHIYHVFKWVKDLENRGKKGKKG